MKRPAFTFIELLVALTLFSVGMLSVLQIFPVNRAFLAQSAQTTQGTFLAQEELELVRAAPYASLSVGTYEARHPVASDASNQLYQFQRTTTVVLVDPASSPTPYATVLTDLGMKRVDVTVDWLEKTRTRQITLSTYVFAR